jgi:hypothetical protein
VTLTLLTFALLVLIAAVHLWHAFGLALAARTVAQRTRAAPAHVEAAMERVAEAPGVSVVLHEGDRAPAELPRRVRDLLTARNSSIEVIVVTDAGSSEALHQLDVAFGLHPSALAPRRAAPHPEVRAAWRSLAHPDLLVLDMPARGPSEARNAALEQARHALVAMVASGAVVDPAALLRAAGRFADEPDLVALVGTLTPVATEGLEAAGIRALVPRWDALAHLRERFAERLALDRIAGMPFLEGACDLVRADALVEVGGYRTDLAAPDLELGVRLRHHAAARGRQWRLATETEPLGSWANAVDAAAVAQRERLRQRGVWTALWHHRAAFLSPRTGRLGLVALPLVLLTQGVSPLLETLAYPFVLIVAAAGFAPPGAVLAFVVLAILVGTLLSHASLGVRTVLARYQRAAPPARPSAAADWLSLTAALSEHLGFRQWTNLLRCGATLGFGVAPVGSRTEATANPRTGPAHDAPPDDSSRPPG